jgi:hypothetical protein
MLYPGLLAGPPALGLFNAADRLWFWQLRGVDEWGNVGKMRVRAGGEAGGVVI